MAKFSLFRMAFLPLCVVLAFVAIANAQDAELSTEAARLDSYTRADGTRFFALSLTPKGTLSLPASTEIVVLFDTSASQTGEYRKEAMAGLKDLLGNLGSDDRVRLMGVDINAVELSDGFVAPDGPEMSKALRKLEQRVPLGATDMEKALLAAADGATKKETARSAIYIGDGMSKAKFVTPENFGQWVDKLVAKKIPVTTYGVGDQVNRRLLGALAAHTGGMTIDGAFQADQDLSAGKRLASAVKAAVLWPDPDSVAWPSEFTSVYPKTMPPLRSDRDTVVIGTYDGDGPFDVEMDLETAAGTQSMTWSVKPEDSKPSNAYLAELAEMAKTEGGVTLPLVGSAALKEADSESFISGRNASQLAKQASSTGDLDSAEQLAREALRHDPQDPVAQKVMADVSSQRSNGGNGGNGADLNLVQPSSAPFDAQGAFVEAVQRDKKIREQMIQAEVRQAINEARNTMATDPNGAIQDLMQQLTSVRQGSELDPDIRDQLVNQLESALRSGRRQEVEQAEERTRALELAAFASQRQQLVKDLISRKKELKVLMQQFNALMDDGKYRMAEELVAAEAELRDPESPTPIAATLWSRTQEYYTNAMAMRVARQKAVVDTLWQVEKSFIPFPGEPPIVYPAADVWRRLSAQRKERYSSMDLTKPNSAEKKIRAALKSSTDFAFSDTPLRDVVAYLEEKHEIEIEVDEGALDDVGSNLDTEITRNLTGITLKSALDLMLNSQDLTYVVENEYLLITTPEEKNTRLSTKVYPVADLVLPIRAPAFSGGFGGMGGSGGMGGMGGGGGMGNNGGGGGGFGGGGFGGGGGGFGGGRGGGGGGGFLNLLPGAGVNGFRAFSVPDDLNLSANDSPKNDSPTNAPKSLPKSTFTLTQKQIKHQAKVIKDAIDDTIRQGDSTKTAWDNYFVANDVEPSVVRQVVRDLVRRREFDQVIALTESALRRGQPQSWMYQAMALAMQAQGRSSEDIERVVMSAVDFCNSSLDLMFLAIYMEKLGLERRALETYQHVAQIEPIQPEPYSYGLSVAKRLDDIEGIEWATIGILSQAWTNDQLNIWKNGLYTAQDTIERLRKAKRIREAKKFQDALDDAVVRDCVIKVSWAGDADIDLIVEEPSGSVCSFRNPRTTSGGVMLGDASSNQVNRNKAGTLSETYVCPKGFSGTYRVLIRRVFGKVTSGKVRVEVFNHYRSQNETVVQKNISLENNESVVKFDLADGRRAVSLEKQQVANASVGHLAVRQHILAQQIARAVDPRAMASLASSRQGDSGQGGLVFAPMRGAVGYQPVIITLPEGTNLAATAVISADRRYVRVTTLPLFSGVSEVNVFNTASGANTSGQGGTGGSGYSGLFNSGGGGSGGSGGGGGGISSY